VSIDSASTFIQIYIQSTPRGFYVFRAATMDNCGGQQANSRGDRPLSPPRDGQQGGICGGPRWQFIVWLHI